MTDQELRKNINSNIRMLKLTTENSPKVFERNQLKKATQIASFIENKLEKNQDLKGQVQQTVFEDEKEFEEISKLGQQLEGRLEELIQEREELEDKIEKLRIAEEEKLRTEEALQKLKLRKRIQEQLKIEEARVKMRADLVRKTREEERKERKPDIKVKLRKLEITKFTGNRLDWTHFLS